MAKEMKDRLAASLLEGTYKLPSTQEPPKQGPRTYAINVAAQKQGPRRCSISVSATTYERLRSSVDGSLPNFVADIVESALDDPTILARVVGKCHLRKATP